MLENQLNKDSIPFDRSFYLLHPYNSALVTSKGRNGKINIMAVAWIIPVNVNPPLVTMSIRPDRYSYSLIKEREEFVVNIPTYDLAQKVLFCGRRSGRRYNKFKETSLTPQMAKKVQVPIIKECIGHLECKVVKTIKFEDHDLIIGQIVEAYAIPEYFEETYDINKFQPCLHIGKNLFTTCTTDFIEPKLKK